MTAVVKPTTIDVSYELTQPNCILIEKLDVNIVDELDEPLDSAHPSKCYGTSNQATLQTISCSLNLFNVKCCGKKTMYVEGTVQCGEDVGTVYAGESSCSASDAECNAMTIDPPWACGCNDETDKCIDTSFTCPECGWEVCDDTQCTPFMSC